MARFTAEGALTYAEAIGLINALKQNGIDANITAGGIAVSPLPEQVNQATEFCSQHGAKLSAGYSSHQEDVLLQTGSFDVVEKATNDALSIIKEWEEK